MITITLHYTPALVRRSVFAYLCRGLGMRTFVALVGTLAATVFLAVSQPESWLTGAVSGAVAVVIVLIIALYFLHYRHGMAKLSRMGQPQAILQLTESGLQISSQAGSFSAPWSTFADLWCFSDLWLLIIGRGQFITLPLADLNDEARLFIASRIRSQRPPVA